MSEDRKRVTESLPKERLTEVSLTTEEREAVRYLLSPQSGFLRPGVRETLRAMLERMR